MKHYTTNNNTKALDALVSDNEATNIAFYLQTILMGYVTSDFYCQSHERERNNFVYAAQATVDLFRHLPVKSNEAHDSLVDYLDCIEPAQAVAVWNEATFGFVSMDAFCDKNELERSSIIYTAQSIISFFSNMAV